MPCDRDITLDEFLALMSSERFDQIEGDMRRIRNHFSCPFTVPDRDAFENTAYAFYAHWYRARFGVDLKSTPENDAGWELVGRPQLIEVLGGWKGFDTASRNAVHGREGGMIAVIDKWTEHLIRQRIDHHIDDIFLDHAPFTKWDLCQRLARELLDRYGNFLFSDDTLRFAPIFYEDARELVRTFVHKRHTIRNAVTRIADNRTPNDTTEDR